MLSKNKKNFIKSLKNKKDRIKNKVFTVEGEKQILEILDSDFEIKETIITKYFYEKYKNLIKNNFEIIEQKELEKISNSISNKSGILVVKQKENIYIEKEKDEFVIVLDNINDPGNLGTILRTCDWYGVKKVIASKNTVELTNPKVISSTMGSIKRVQIFYTDLEKYIEGKNDEIYGTFLEGENIHKINVPKKGGYIIIGNESLGINKNLEKLVTKKITIPRFGKAESLNAGVATGIVLDNLLKK
ncbi:RNA methyltransferase [Candidatus Gracilibacteria bacterium]|nr:MAG: RNA methyltransferase [Candidatus Gracilibacteria bacterium]